MSDHIKAREGETIANNKIYVVQIVIQFINYFRGRTGTTISIGSYSCVTTSDNCGPNKVLCDVGDVPAGTYNVVISTTYGYPSYGDGLNRLAFEYSVSPGFSVWKKIVFLVSLLHFYSSFYYLVKNNKS